jgi:hypothetical protein
MFLYEEFGDLNSWALETAFPFKNSEELHLIILKI